MAVVSPISRKMYFYPRSPCGERHVLTSAEMNYYTISIHALLAESDLDDKQRPVPVIKFLSTLSLRRATCFPGFCRMTAEFLSTLSLRRATAAGRLLLS